MVISGAEINIGESVGSLSIASDQSFAIAGTSNQEVNFLKLLRDPKTQEITKIERDEKLILPVGGRVSRCPIDRGRTFVLIGSGSDQKIRLLDIFALTPKHLKKKKTGELPSSTVTLERQKKEVKFPPDQKEYQQQQKLLLVLQDVSRGLAEKKD